MKTSATFFSSFLLFSLSFLLLLLLLPSFIRPVVALDSADEQVEEVEECVFDCMNFGFSSYCSCQGFQDEDESPLFHDNEKRGGAFPFRYGRKRQMPFRYGKRSVLVFLPSLSSYAKALEKRQFRYGKRHAHLSSLSSLSSDPKLVDKRQFRYGKRSAESSSLSSSFNPQSASAYNQLSSTTEQ